MGRVTAEPTIVERMIRAARAAVRLREEAAKDSTEPDVSVALLRASHRYSGHVAELAEEMLREVGR